jgi:hypothetical protein
MPGERVYATRYTRYARYYPYLAPKYCRPDERI